MKKLILLLAMPLMLSGCFEKESVQPATVQTQSETETKLSGTWIKSMIRIKYLDASGSVINQANVTDENGDKIIFSNGTATFIENTGGQASIPYQIIESGASVGLLFVSGSDSLACHISRLESNVLHLERQFDQLKYGAKSAVMIEEFSR